MQAEEKIRLMGTMRHTVITSPRGMFRSTAIVVNRRWARCADEAATLARVAMVMLKFTPDARLCDHDRLRLRLALVHVPSEMNAA